MGRGRPDSLNEGLPHRSRRRLCRTATLAGGAAGASVCRSHRDRSVSRRRPVGVNERFRCYRYTPGQRFKAHYDGAFQRNRSECSELTFLIYLDDGFTGGQTAFHDFAVDVVARPGMALLFQHRLLHEGCAVQSGVKYVLRSDVMYAG